MQIRDLGLATGLIWLGACSGPAEIPLRPVANVQQLMTHIVDPAADVVWDAVGTVITSEGEEHWEPETDEEWTFVLNGAITITEAANLLMIGERARDQEAWMRMAQGMAEAGLLAVEAAEAQDAEAIFEIGEDVYNSCERCHNLYWVGDEDRGRVRDENPQPPVREE